MILKAGLSIPAPKIELGASGTALSDLGIWMVIGLGHSQVKDDRQHFFNEIEGTYHVCALGAAIIGRFDDIQRAAESIREAEEASFKYENIPADEVVLAKRILGIPLGLAQAITDLHVNGRSAAIIAADILSGRIKWRK